MSTSNIVNISVKIVSTISITVTVQNTVVGVATGNATVENSDASKSVLVPISTTLVIPSATFKLSDVVDTDFNLITNGATQAQRDKFQRINSIPTGQTTSFATGDDGDTELGRGFDFLTLDDNNPFLNTNRFTDSVGGQDYDGTGGSIVDYIIDHSTGLAWYRVEQGTAAWATAISNANASTVATFSDWRIPNRQELENICHRGLARPLTYSPFLLQTGAAATVLYWTSTTHIASTISAFSLITNHATQAKSAHRLDEQTKTTPRNYIFCRTHF